MAIKDYNDYYVEYEAMVEDEKLYLYQQTLIQLLTEEMKEGGTPKDVKYIHKHAYVPISESELPTNKSEFEAWYEVVEKDEYDVLPTFEEFEEALPYKHEIRKYTYARTRVLTSRRNLYPKIEEQLDMQFKDERDGTTIWKDSINTIKTENPYPPEFDDSEYLAMRAAK